MKTSQDILCSIFWILYLITPCLGLETKYYYIIGGSGAGGVLILIILISICFCKSSSKRKVPERDRNFKPSSGRHYDPPAPRQISLEVASDIRIDPGRRDSHSAPASPKFIRNQPNEQGIRASLDPNHRRRLDAILTAQAASLNREDNEDNFNPGQVQRSSSTHRPYQAHILQNQRVLPTVPTFHPNFHERGTTVSEMEYQNHIPNHFENPDNVIVSFERIKPMSPSWNHQKTNSYSTDQTFPEQLEEHDFLKTRLRPAQLNRGGGTYIPPDDF